MADKDGDAERQEGQHRDCGATRVADENGDRDTRGKESEQYRRI